MPSSLNELRDQCFADADNHGLWDDDYVFVQTQPTEIMKRYASAELIEAEVHEMKRAVDAPNHYAEELADVIIMALSVAGYLKIDIDAAVRQKMDANRIRKWRHGK